MYQGNNPTALQSQKMIINALLRLMKKKNSQKLVLRNFVKLQ